MSIPDITDLVNRLAAQEKWQRKHVMEFSEFRRETDERLKVIEPVARDIAEILNYTKTTSKVVIWAARIGSAITALGGAVVVIQRWVM